MKKLIVFAVAVLAFSAFAEETPMLPGGSPVYATDGGTAHSQYTAPGTNTFKVPQNAKLTVNCNEDSFICVNQLPCNAGTGIPVPQNVPVTTSCSYQSGLTLIDAGTFVGCIVANSPNVSDGGVWSKCYWKTRVGTEGP